VCNKHDESAASSPQVKQWRSKAAKSRRLAYFAIAAIPTFIFCLLGVALDYFSNPYVYFVYVYGVEALSSLGALILVSDFFLVTSYSCLGLKFRFSLSVSDKGILARKISTRKVSKTTVADITANAESTTVNRTTSI